MGYVKKSLQRINKVLDDREIPENWNKFIEECSKSENILIRKKNNYLFCTNCQKEYKYTQKLKSVLKCKFCHEELEVKHWNVRNVKYLKTLVLVDKVDDEYIFRMFELRSIYENGEWDRSVVEFGRHFYKENVDLIRQNVCRVMGGTHVNHNEDMKYSQSKWRTFDSYWRSVSTRGQVYHYNLKDLFKGTEYQYSQIWELAKKVDCIDIDDVMRQASWNKSFELLVKAKLYNLALKADKYEVKGSFEDRFKVPKEFYPFMVKHNIKSEELDKLTYLNKPNINNVRYLLKFSNYRIEEVIKYVKAEDFIKYSQKIKNFDIDTYKDYLRFCDSLGFNMKDKKILFPRTGKELDKKHDELEKQYEIRKDEILNESINKRYEELKENIFKEGQFIITPADTIESLIDESKQQNNCVRTYSERYAEGECDIYFMRNIKTPNKSLVTVEVRHKEIIQCRIKNNERVTENQEKWLNKWQEKVLNKAV